MRGRTTTWLAIVAATAAGVAWLAVVNRPAPEHDATAFRPGVAQVEAPQVSAPVTSRGPTFPAEQASAAGREATSRLWFVDGRWWGLLTTGRGGLGIYELASDHTWRDTGTLVDSRPKTTGDVLWDGQHLLIVSRTADGALVVNRLSYDQTRRAFAPDAGFPTRIALGGALVATIARDGTGALWVAFVQHKQVYVLHSDGDDRVWSAPALLPVSQSPVLDEDIAAVVSFAGHVGVMWSDQPGGAFHFTTHADGAPPGTWSKMETPLSNPKGADNHISLKAASDGRLFAAVKTSYGDTPGHTHSPQIVLLVRQPAGVWESAPVALVSDGATRAVVTLDDSHHIAYVMLTAPEAGGIVYVKGTGYDRPRFVSGRGQPFISRAGAPIGGASTTKQAVGPASGLVVLGSDERAGVYYRADMKIGQ